MKILLIITSSVGCYKALDLIREFQKKSINFEIIATKNTFEFISPLLLESISHQKVYSELFDLDMEKNIRGGTIYNKFVFELRHPISLNPNATIFGLTFIEAGNNWNSQKDFNPFELYRSAGLGVRIFMPAFGLLGIDFGYGFDPILGGVQPNGWETHFIIGQQF